MGFEWKKDVALAAALVVLALGALGFLLEPGVMPYSKHSDLIAYHLPLKYAAYQGMSAGDGLPLWRSDMLSGGPALTNPQAVYTHPLQWPFLWLHPTTASGPSLWLNFLCMALSMQVLGAVLGLGLLGRAFMAVAGMFSFKLIMITYAGWLPVLPGFAAAPLLIAGVLAALDRPGKRSTLLLALAGSLALLSGHLQVPYYLVLFLAVYALVSCAGRFRDGATDAGLRALASCAAAAVLALATAAYLFLPLAYELDLTARTTSQFGFLQSGGSYAFENLATFLHPEFLGTPLDGSYEAVELWENVAYFGAVAQLLALFGIGVGFRRPHVKFFAVAFVLSILLTFDSFLLRLLYDFVPGFSLFRHPSRFLFLTTLFGIGLAGVGFDALMQRFRAEGTRTGMQPVALVIAAALIAVTAWEGVGFARRYLPTLAASQIVPKTRYAEYFARDPETFRVAPLQRYAINYGWGAFMGAELVTGFEPYNYRHYQRYMELVTSNRVVEPEPVVWTDLPQISRWDLLDVLGVKYVVSLSELAPVPHDLELVALFGAQPIYGLYEGLGTADISVYKNPHARPRAYWASELVVEGDPDRAAQAVRNADLSRVTVVESPAGLAEFPPPQPDDVLSIVERSAARIAFESASDRGGFAVISEVWHPGWRATLDGTPIEILRSNVALMGVSLPAGRHRLELEFRPLGFDAGLLLTGLGLAGMALLTGACVRAAVRGPVPRSQ